MTIVEINEGFGFSNARNSEHYDIHLSFQDAITQEFVDELGIGVLRANHAALFTIERACYKRNRALEATPDILAVDKRRDNAFLFISQTIAAGCYSPNDTKREAAERLAYILEPYKNSPRMPLVQNSASVADFLEKMQEEQCVTDIETLGITEEIGVLKEANDEFRQIYRQRSMAEHEKAKSETMKTIRPKVDEAFRELAKTINAIYRTNAYVDRDEEKAAKIKAVIDQVNADIYRLQKTLIQAGVISKSSKEEGAESGNSGDDLIEPKIVRVFQVEGGDAEHPEQIERGTLTQIDWIGGFELVDQTKEKPGKIILRNTIDYDEVIKEEDIVKRWDSGCQFIMVPDLTEDQYSVRIETYDGGNPLVVTYDKKITLI